VIFGITGGTAFSLALFPAESGLNKAKKRCWKYSLIEAITRVFISCPFVYFVAKNDPD